MERPSGSRAASVLVNVFLRGLKKKLNSTLMSESLRKKQAISTMMERLAQKGIEQAQRKQSNYSYQTKPDRCIFQNNISKSPSESETV